MKHRNRILAVLAVVLVLAMSIGPSWAYFTATTSTAGSATIHVKPTTTIDEDVIEGAKRVVITNVGAEDVFVRARAYAGEAAGNITYAGEGWRDGGDGWWYYDEILTTTEEGKDSEELLVTISALKDDKDGLEDGQNFSVVVVHESVPARYDDDGIAYADWTGVD